MYFIYKESKEKLLPTVLAFLVIRSWCAWTLVSVHAAELCAAIGWGRFCVRPGL